MDFLKDELFGLPAAAHQAILAELEAVVREISVATASDNPDITYDLNCMRACTRIASTLRFAMRLREQLKKQEAK